MDDPDRFLVIGVAPGAEHHRAETEPAHADAGTTERPVLHQAARPNLAAERARRRSASASRSRGGADVTSSASRCSVACATASTAAANATSFAREGFCMPLTLRTYCRAAER